MPGVDRDLLQGAITKLLENMIGREELMKKSSPRRQQPSRLSKHIRKKIKGVSRGCTSSIGLDTLEKPDTGVQIMMVRI